MMSEAGNTKYNIEYPVYRTSPHSAETRQQPFAQSVLRVYEKLFELPTFIMINRQDDLHDTELFVSDSIQPLEAQLRTLLSKITELPICGDDVQIFPHRFRNESTSAAPFQSATQFIALMPLSLQDRVIAVVGILCNSETNTSTHFPRAHFQKASDQLINADLTKKLKSFRNLARILVPGLLRILSANDLNDTLRIHDQASSRYLLPPQQSNPREIFTVCNIDPLTGLRTRESFEQLISDAIESVTDPDQRVALFYVDLDHLKVINDAHGHAAGDAALVAISDRLKQMECENITALRLGGDEFALLLEDTTCHQIRALLEELPATLSHPIYHEHSEIRPKVSIGAAVFPRHANNVKELQESADTALYHAKKRGRNRASLFNQVMRTRLDRQVTLQRTAKQALMQNQVGTVFQPIRTCKTSKIKMLEARPDWPTQILEIARGSDLSKIFDSASFSDILGDTTIAAIIHTMRACQNTSMEPWEFLFRVPVPSLLKEGFCDDLSYLLQENNVRPDKFTLEIPSRVLLRANAHILISQLNELTNTGVKLCINHFDSGGLKIEHFQKLNISYIKLHAGSVEKLFEDEKTARLLIAATEFAHALNIEIILSEIKNAHTEEKLKELGAEYVQGEFYAPEQRFSEIYKKHVLGISQDPIQRAKSSITHRRVSRLPSSMIN
ncbi:sensor domain-containing diguanylate cyclase [Pseudovibrio brasiliensis]|uniref:Diguanylate cyclase n=1 Tax=Pseudovibrio brasiliensis TaxID=1898042 RepID=A0ABX8AIL7_9HYPH|nr:diguanylate cyclase [Pseudovibrio brasiliensis]QUS54918.1 diguanylate cyclase [Pseudovibrio brasiliensis]